MQRKFLINVELSSQLSGCNYKQYPLHKFTFFNTFEEMYPIFPHFCGRDYWHRKCFRQRVNSNTFAIEYVESGEFIFIHNDVEEICRPGEIFLVQYGCNCSMRCKTLTAVKRTVCISGQLLPTLLTNLGLDNVFYISNIDTALLNERFDQLDEYAKPEKLDLNKLSSLCYSLLLTLAEQAVLRPRPPELQRALKLMSHSMEKNLKLTDLVKYSNSSKTTLYRLFKEHFNSSPLNYFIALKMKHAKSLLQYHPVKQVAAMMEFCNAQYFSKEFKKHFGVSPKHFRLQQPSGKNGEESSPPATADHD